MLDHNNEDTEIELDDNTVICTKKLKKKVEKKLLLRLQNTKSMVNLLMMRLPLIMETRK